ncbi:hypothetical protein [Nocardia sp. NPDC050175]|uniref:hypothetical protein n=1 Tax=Nocardia sp. NPDC050175 TaxID=3364317 RepID=UPI00378DBBBF
MSKISVADNQIRPTAFCPADSEAGGPEDCSWSLRTLSVYEECVRTYSIAR